jgi:hypothetical protein
LETFKSRLETILFKEKLLFLAGYVVKIAVTSSAFGEVHGLGEVFSRSFDVVTL